MKRAGVLLSGAALAWAITQLNGGISQAQADLTVADGMTVTVEYTLMLSDKSVVDSNVGQTPFAYTQGEHQIVPGLEKALVGMKPGQKKRVDVTPEEGYGIYDKKARLTVDKGKVPENVKAGMELRSTDGRIVKVLEVTEKGVVLDLNHPLAGKDLVFDIKVLKVEKPASPSAGKKP
jgi:FKBP-type peptidyl-prolyl cis-trans isomerase SlyD